MAGKAAILEDRNAGWSSLVARRAHNPKVVGSNPAPATKEDVGKGRCESTGPSAVGNRVPPDSHQSGSSGFSGVRPEAYWLRNYGSRRYSVGKAQRRFILNV